MNQLSKYDAFIFDCDGVVFDSNNLKVEAMRESLDSLGIASTEVENCCSFFAKNFGKSRFYHIEYFVNNIIYDYQGDRGELSTEILRLYAARTRKLYLKAPLTPNFSNLLDSISSPKFIASGSEENELRWVFGQRNLAKSFSIIYGSPTPKSTNVRKAIGEGSFRAPLMIGDALSDLEAAVNNSIDFLGYLPFSNVREELKVKADENGFRCIDDWSEIL